MLRDYDIQTYNDMETMLIEYGECCLVGHTGIGKTRISMEFVFKYNLNTLVVSDRIYINNNWKSWANKSDISAISAITTQYFAKNYKLFITGFDCYIFDEAHHLGAKKWGKSYREFKKLISDKCFIIGLTATPKRYFDFCGITDITKTIFGGHAVYTISRKEAIGLGIIGESYYVCALYDSGELNRLYSKKRMTEELRGKLDYVTKNQPEIGEILLKHAPKGNPKGIVYVDRINAIDDGVKIISMAFPRQPIWFIHSKLPKDETVRISKEFEEAESGFIVNVDMMTEGVHYPGVNMIIMLRRTVSPNKFIQQAGRASNSDKSVIFDFVGNAKSIKMMLKRIGEGRKEFINIENVDSYEQYVSGQNIVADYASDFLKVLDEIDIYCKNCWTEEEDRILRENYPTLGGDVCELLPGRSKQSCCARASMFGIEFCANRWSEEEIQILRDNYPKMGSDVCELIPGRSALACKCKANKLGLIVVDDSYWTEEEDNIIRDNYLNIGGDICELLPGRTMEQCRMRANRLNIVKAKRFSKEEDQILRDNYPKMGLDVYKLLPNRSRKVINNRIVALGLKDPICKKWTEEEDKIFKDNYPSMGSDVISYYLEELVVPANLGL